MQKLGFVNRNSYLIAIACQNSVQRDIYKMLQHIFFLHLQVHFNFFEILCVSSWLILLIEFQMILQSGFLFVFNYSQSSGNLISRNCKRGVTYIGSFVMYQYVHKSFRGPSFHLLGFHETISDRPRSLNSKVALQVMQFH